MACTNAVVREGPQRSLVRILQVLRVATARSPQRRIRAWALFTDFGRHARSESHTPAKRLAMQIPRATW